MFEFIQNKFNKSSKVFNSEKTADVQTLYPSLSFVRLQLRLVRMFFDLYEFFVKGTLYVDML